MLCCLLEVHGQGPKGQGLKENVRVRDESIFFICHANIGIGGFCD